jgi:hypothetical protein
VRFDALLGARMTWVAVGSGDGPGSIRGVAIAPDDTVLVENRDFRDPRRLLQRSLGAQSIVLVRPDRVIHSHFPSRRSIGASTRSASCHTHAVLDHRTTAAFSSPA